MLSLQFIGRLLVGLPNEKKGPKFFNLAVGRSKSLSESHKKFSLRMQPIFSAISDRLFRFPQTDHLCATLFDVLLGGASPKQVIELCFCSLVLCSIFIYEFYEFIYELLSLQFLTGVTET